MRVVRNVENTDLARDFEEWKEKAKGKYEDYKNNKLSSEDFIKWLNNNE